MLQKIIWPETQGQYQLGFPLGSVPAKDVLPKSTLPRSPSSGAVAEGAEAKTDSSAAAVAESSDVMMHIDTSSTTADGSISKSSSSSNIAVTANSLPSPDNTDNLSEAVVAATTPIAAVPSAPLSLNAQRANLVKCLSNNLLPEGE